VRGLGSRITENEKKKRIPRKDRRKSQFVLCWGGGAADAARNESKCGVKKDYGKLLFLQKGIQIPFIKLNELALYKTGPSRIGAVAGRKSQPKEGRVGQFKGRTSRGRKGLATTPMRGVSKSKNQAEFGEKYGEEKRRKRREGGGCSSVGS